MARTTRRIPPGDWDQEFKDKSVRGHISVPKKAVSKTGREIMEEVWGQERKRFNKRMDHRAKRRAGKNVIDEMMG